jgi:hypothetical protein
MVMSQGQNGTATERYVVRTYQQPVRYIHDRVNNRRYRLGGWSYTRIELVAGDELNQAG